jgi:hypothetical protein
LNDGVGQILGDDIIDLDNFMDEVTVRDAVLEISVMFA